MTEASGPAAGVWGSHTELLSPLALGRNQWLGNGNIGAGVLGSTSIADR